MQEICTPGCSISFVADENDLDFSEKYRCVGYK